MNLNDLFAITQQERPHRTALEFRTADGVVAWTYAELRRRAERMARNLHARGVRQGDRVVLFAGNSGPFVVAFLALLQLGAIAVLVNFRYRRREMAFILADCRPRLLLADAARRASLADMDLPPALMQDVAVADMASAERAAAGRRPSVRIAGDDAAFILYTSGTTGRSKGAVITHNNALATVTGLISAWAWRAADVLLLTLPLFHIHGLEVGLLCALAAGATVLLRRAFDAADVLACLHSGRPSLFFGVPTMYFRLMQALAGGPPPDWGHMRLFCSGSAPLAAADHQRFERLTGHVILERYGMTETGMNFSNPYAGARVPGTVGLPLPGVSARLVDAADRPLAPGQEGHLQVRGSHVFAAYWEAPELTAQSFVNDEAGRQWFRTGDMGRLDPDTGYLTLLGRSHEFILSGGFNVYPREIEEVLMQCPGVREAAVIGQAHPEWGEVPLAYLVVDGSFQEAAAAAFCRRQLAGFKVPAAFRIVDVLPRNALGKLQKFRLANA